MCYWYDKNEHNINCKQKLSFIKKKQAFFKAICEKKYSAAIIFNELFEKNSDGEPLKNHLRKKIRMLIMLNLML